MKKIIVSVIVSAYNSKDNLVQTLDSILEQTYERIEIIVKDGGSTDGTVEILQEYANKNNSKIKYISSPDKGIYDSMNQGYHMSTGEIVVFMNDIFCVKTAVSQMVSLIEEDPTYIGGYADYNYIKNEKIVRECKIGIGTIKQGWMPGHPTLFLKRDVYEKYGLYHTDYKIAADYEFIIRILQDEQNKLCYLPCTIVSMFYGGTSTNGISSYFNSWREGHRALKSNHISKPLVIDIRRSFNVIKQFSILKNKKRR